MSEARVVLNAPGRTEAIVQINRERMTIERRVWTLNELRSLTSPPIPADYDVWRTVPGALDERVPEDGIEVFDGLRIFSTPRFINN